MREAHRLLADALEGLQRGTADLSARIEQADQTRSDELTSEVRMLEDLVQRMGQDITAKLSGLRR